MKLSLTDIARNCDIYPSGFAQALAREGKQVASAIEITPEQFGALVIRFRSTAGLGDIVARFAQPVARTIDRIAGTDLEHCPKCKQRQEALNSIRLADFNH